MTARHFVIRKNTEYLQTKYEPYTYGPLATACLWTEDEYLDDGIAADLSPGEQVVEVAVVVTPVYVVDPCNLAPETP